MHALRGALMIMSKVCSLSSSVHPLQTHAAPVATSRGATMRTAALRIWWGCCDYAHAWLQRMSGAQGVARALLCVIGRPPAGCLHARIRLQLGLLGERRWGARGPHRRSGVPSRIAQVAAVERPRLWSA